MQQRSERPVDQPEPEPGAVLTTGPAVALDPGTARKRYDVAGEGVPAVIGALGAAVDAANVRADPDAGALLPRSDRSLRCRHSVSGDSARGTVGSGGTAVGQSPPAMPQVAGTAVHYRFKALFGPLSMLNPGVVLEPGSTAKGST